jgi:N-carbamoyl-L-amino-acid hydrolase
MTVDSGRLTRELDELAAISAMPAPVVTRVVFTEADLRGRAFFKQLCRDANLSIREDAAGNTFARWTGSDPSLPAVATGSHIDAIPNAGRYDGSVGVLGGLEAIRALQRSGYQPHRSIELILFTSEEPTRFGIGCLGSRLMSGILDASSGDSLKDRDGLSLNHVRASAGFTGDLATVRLAAGTYTAFVELHIEQGPLLEQRGIDLGIVTAIAAPAGLKISIEGDGGHAGAVLMPARRDAFLAAAEIALAVEAAAKSSGSIDTVGTVGVCEVFPGAVNSVPSRARLEVDFRDTDGARRDAALERLYSACDEIAQRRRVTIHRELVNADPPAQCGPELVTALQQAAVALGASSQLMISRAYHDTLFMAKIAPAAMLFIPSRNGYSHRPDEYSSPESIAQGTAVLAETLKHLARSGN